MHAALLPHHHSAMLSYITSSDLEALLRNSKRAKEE